MRRLFLGALLFTLAACFRAEAKPTERQISADSVSFHQFRIAAVEKATEINRRSSDESAGGKYLGVECARLAHRTSPDYLYGIVEDLIRDNSRTEDPYFVAIMVLDHYPPDAARRVVKKIMADPEYAACTDVKNWLWEIDEAQKAEPH